MPHLDAVRQIIQSLGASAAEHYVIGDQRLVQQQDRPKDLAFPFLFAKALHSRFSKVLLDDVSVAIWQVAKLERQHIGFPNQRRSQSSAQSEKQHSPAAKTAERLHAGVIVDPHRFAYGLLK